MLRIRSPRMWLPALLIAWAPLTAAAPPAHPAPVTIVSIPWGTATIEGSSSFVVPGTVLLEPGEYTVRIERNGYRAVERTLRIVDGSPQNHVFHLETR